VLSFVCLCVVLCVGMSVNGGRVWQPMGVGTHRGGGEAEGERVHGVSSMVFHLLLLIESLFSGEGEGVGVGAERGRRVGGHYGASRLRGDEEESTDVNEHVGYMVLSNAPVWVTVANLIVYLFLSLVTLWYVWRERTRLWERGYLGFQVCVVVFVVLRVAWAVLILLEPSDPLQWSPALYAFLFVCCALGFCFYFTSFLLVIAHIHSRMRGRIRSSVTMRLFLFAVNAFLYLFVIAIAIVASQGSACTSQHYDEESTGLFRRCRKGVDYLVFGADVVVTSYTFCVAVAFSILAFLLRRKARRIRSDSLHNPSPSHSLSPSSYSSSYTRLSSSASHLSTSSQYSSFSETELESNFSDESDDSLLVNGPSPPNESALSKPTASRFSKDYFTVLIVCFICVVCFMSRGVSFLLASQKILPAVVFLFFGFWMPEVPCTVLFLFLMSSHTKRPKEREETFSLTGDGEGLRDTHYYGSTAPPSRGHTAYIWSA
jgi:hypothetical protein